MWGKSLGIWKTFVFLFTKWEITYSYRVTELCGKVTKRLRAAIKPISINTINSKAARLYFHTVLNQHGHSSALTLSINTSSEQVFGELLLSVSPVAHFYCNQHWSAASSPTPKVHLHPLFYVHIVLFTPFEERNLW